MTSVTSDSYSEMIRRLRLGNLRTLFRHRYGPILPDDDAGREDLRELLLPISTGPHADIKMPKAIEVWAPWMSRDEAIELIDRINLTPIYHRKPSAELLGFRQRVSNQERERLRLWTIAAYDMTAEELLEQHRAKRRNRDRQRQRKAGRLPRSAYLAKSLSSQKPWEIAGISRRTWYRQRGTSMRPSNTPKRRRIPVPLSKLQGRKERAVQKQGVRKRRVVARTSVLAPSASTATHTCATDVASTTTQTCLTNVDDRRNSRTPDEQLEPERNKR